MPKEKTARYVVATPFTSFPDPFTASEMKMRPEPYHLYHDKRRSQGRSPHHSRQRRSSSFWCWLYRDPNTIFTISIHDWTALFVLITIISFIVFGVKCLISSRNMHTAVRNAIQSAPATIPIFSSGPNDTVALGCLSPEEERKGKDPYMPGLFYQFSMTFSRADGLYAARQFCQELVEGFKVLGLDKVGGVDMIEKTYDTKLGSKKVTARVQWDVDGVYDNACKKSTDQFNFGSAANNHEVHAKCVQYLSQPIEFCDIVTKDKQPPTTNMNKVGGSFFKDCIFWSVYLAPPGRGPTEEDDFV